jgi:hypothetical protein
MEASPAPLSWAVKAFTSKYVRASAREKTAATSRPTTPPSWSSISRRTFGTRVAPPPKVRAMSPAKTRGKRRRRIVDSGERTRRRRSLPTMARRTRI